MPVRKDPQGRWHAEACVGRRRLHRRLPEGASANDAKRIEAELTKALNVQAPAGRQTVIPGDPLLTSLMADYTERHAHTLRSTDTAQYHGYRISKWLEGKRASETRLVAAKILVDLHGHYAPATINRSLGALKKALSAAWDRGETPVDYSTLVKRVPENNARTVYLSLEQVKLIADRCSPQVRAAVWVSMLTGCRRGEVCKVKAADIGDHIIKLQAGNTKTLRYREVPIVDALRPWLAYLPLKIGFEGVKSGFRRAREKAGMPEVHFHDLRHSCATVLLGLGADLHVVREILGHSSVKTTERYAHVMTAPQRAALDLMGALQLKMAAGG